MPESCAKVIVETTHKPLIVNEETEPIPNVVEQDIIVEVRPMTDLEGLDEDKPPELEQAVPSNIVGYDSDENDLEALD